LYADVFSKTYGLHTIGLRYYNVFGPKQSPTNAYAAVIPKFVSSALSHTPPTIFGDGETSRDFTFIENVVQANINALLSYPEINTHEVVNIAYGKRTSLNRLWNLIVNHLNCESLMPSYSTEREGDVKHSLAEISKAQKLINYYPLFDVKSGLKITIEYLKTQNYV
jgi:UDP-N-acetylglucosamine 4-epimerase